MKIKNEKYFWLFVVVAVFVFVAPKYLFASDSANFNMEQERGGSIEFDATSANYQMKAEVAHPGVGQSTSANYTYDHGTWWADSADITATIQWAVPEFRVGPDATNDDTTFYLVVMTASDVDDTILFTSPLHSSSNDGTFTTQIDLTGILAGTYDVGFKGHQHITKKLDDVVLVSGNNVLNFTQADNSAPKGVIELIGGDINGDASTPAELGDDIVNSVDITVLLSTFNTDDPTGNAERANINQDPIVNSVDLTIVLANFNEEGDS